MQDFLSCFLSTLHENLYDTFITYPGLRRRGIEHKEAAAWSMAYTVTTVRNSKISIKDVLLTIADMWSIISSLTVGEDKKLGNR